VGNQFNGDEIGGCIMKLLASSNPSQFFSYDRLNKFKSLRLIFADFVQGTIGRH